MIIEYLKTGKEEVEATLQSLLNSPYEEYKPLYESMNYSLLMGGKRIRPILSKLVIEALHKDYKPYMKSLCAIELIHTYSLVHDDLPAMDNDDYRRGKLTNHKVYGDGMAILAGDGLLTYAFQLITEDPSLRAEQKVALIGTLSRGAGPAGMVGGQAFDLLSEGKDLPLEELVILHQGKTGALFKSAVEAGLIIGDASKDNYRALMDYADYLGLLFQITDDILDVTGTLEALGKQPGSDEASHKATYVSILGLEEAKDRATDIKDKALACLNAFDGYRMGLIELTEYILQRRN